MRNSRLKSLSARISSTLTATPPVGPLIYFLVSHLLLSLVYITVFARVFSYGRRMILLHLLLIAGGLLLWLLLFAVLTVTRTIENGRKSRLLFALVASVCFTLLLLLYVGDAASNFFWFDNLTYQQVVNNVSDLSRHLRVIHLSPNWVYLVLVLTFLTTFFVYFKLSSSMLSSFEQLAARLRSYGLFSDRGRTLDVTLVVALVLVGYGGTVAVMLGKIRGGGSRQAEPILSFFAPQFFRNRGRDAWALAAQQRALAARQMREQYVAPADFERKNVILIIVDSLRADHTPMYGYYRDTTPFLNQLAQQKQTRKVNIALASCSFSTCGILSVLTSRSAEEQEEEEVKLYDLLYDQGYKVYLTLSGDHTGMAYLRRSYGDSMNFYYDGSSSKRFHPNDDRVLFEALEQVPAYHGVPTFFYVHLMSAHRLGMEWEGYQKYQPVPRATQMLPLQNYEPVELVNSYDNRVFQADDVIRQVFDLLTSKGYTKDSLVIILSDHGESLGEHNAFGHGKSIYQEELNIPLLILDNSEANYRNLDFATQLDIAPTVFARLGLPIPPSWEGRSLLDPYHDGITYHQSARTVLSNGPGSKIVPAFAAVIYRDGDKTYKYIAFGAEPREEVYELKTDPGEKNNLIATVDKTLLGRMREIMAQHVAKVK